MTLSETITSVGSASIVKRITPIFQFRVSEIMPYVGKEIQIGHPYGICRGILQHIVGSQFKIMLGEHGAISFGAACVMSIMIVVTPGLGDLIEFKLV